MPHRIELLATEPSHLARNHVASTHHQIGLKGNQSLHPLMNGRDVAGGAIAAVEVTDQPDPQRRPVGSPYRQKRSTTAGSKHQLQQPATTQLHKGTGVSMNVLTVAPRSDQQPKQRWQ